MLSVHLSINGIPGTLWEIRRQEKTHWLLGYRQALLIVGSQKKALLQGEIARLKLDREILQKKSAIAESEGVDREIAIAELELLELNLKEHLRLIEDAQIELNLAQQEMERIEGEHPGFEHLSQEELGPLLAEAFQNKLARNVAIATYAKDIFLPEGTAEVLYDLQLYSEEERDRIMQQINANLTPFVAQPRPEEIPSGFPSGFPVLPAQLNF